MANNTNTVIDVEKGEPMIHNSLAELGEILDSLSADSLFIVADPIAYQQSGAKKVLDKELTSPPVTIFNDFSPNPTLEEVIDGIEQYKSGQPDVVLAIGGGTAIDLAKLIGICAVQPETPRELILSPLSSYQLQPRKPLIAVPTTAGTGSEATHFAVVYVEGKKYSVADPSLVPDYAILDASLTKSMPPGLTAESGLDAFTHAIESMWSVHSTPESMGYAAEAIRLTWQHLESAVSCPTLDDRRAMCRAAHLAGKAINISKTTASHAISYSITSQYSVPHGRAVALTIGPMLAYVSEVTEEDCNDERGVDYLRQVVGDITELLGCESAAEADRAIRQFVESLGCPTRLSAIGVTTNTQIETIANQVNVERLANNPRRFSEDSLRAFLCSIQ